MPFKQFSPNNMLCVGSIQPTAQTPTLHLSAHIPAEGSVTDVRSLCKTAQKHTMLFAIIYVHHILSTNENTRYFMCFVTVYDAAC